MHTVPGYPNTVQTDVTLSLFNVTPFSPGGFKFLKTTEAASKQAQYYTRRYSKAYSTSVLVENDEGGELGKATFTDQKGESATVAAPNIPLDQVTKYPAESWPFVKAYRSVLSDLNQPRYPNVLTAPTWPSYSSDNEDMEFLYHSTEQLVLDEYRLRKNLENFSTLQKTLDLMYSALSTNTVNARDAYFSRDRIVSIQSELTNTFRELIVNIRNTTYLIAHLRKDITEAWSRFQGLALSTKDIKNLNDLNLNFQFLDPQGKNIEDIITIFLKDYAPQLDKLTRDILTPKSQDDSTKTKPNLPQEVLEIYRDLQRGAVISINEEIQRIIDLDIPPETNVQQKMILVSQPTSDKQKVSSSDPNIKLFAAPVTGISITYRNNVLPIPISGFDRPTYQHMGGSNANISINMRTGDEELIKTLSGIRESASVLSRLVATGDIALEGLDRITIKHGLLQSFGLLHFSISSININSIPSAPGWYEVFVDLIQNDSKLSTYEAVRLVSRPASQSDAWEYFFPVKDIKFPIAAESLKLTKEDQTSVAAEKKAERVIMTPEGPMISSGNSPLTPRELKEELIVGKLNAKLKDKYGLAPHERVDTIIEFGVTTLSNKKEENHYYFYPSITNRYTQKRNPVKSDLYAELIKPVLERAQEICGLIRKTFGHSSMIISLVASV